jgi:hypothetical protein
VRRDCGEVCGGGDEVCGAEAGPGMLSFRALRFTALGVVAASGTPLNVARPGVGLWSSRLETMGTIRQ